MRYVTILVICKQHAISNKDYVKQMLRQADVVLARIWVEDSGYYVAYYRRFLRIVLKEALELLDLYWVPGCRRLHTGSSVNVTWQISRSDNLLLLPSCEPASDCKNPFRTEAQRGGLHLGSVRVALFCWL